MMRRTLLYLDEQLWGALHARAQKEKTTISELVRQAARERYLGDTGLRREAMRNFVGTRKSRPGSADSTDEVRRLRRGSRIDRLQ